MEAHTFFSIVCGTATACFTAWLIKSSFFAAQDPSRQRLIAREIRGWDEHLSWLEEVDLDVQVLERLERPAAAGLAGIMATHREAAQARRQLLQKAQEDGGILLGPNPLGAQQAAVKAAQDAFNNVAAASERYPMSAIA